MNTVTKINETLVSLFNIVLKIEEKALRQSAKHDLSITEMHTLVAIGEGKPKTMTQVANTLKISVSTLTAAINKLVNKDYVRRFRVPEDRRIVRIELTDSGAAAVREHEDFHIAMISDAIEGLTHEEAQRFAESIENLNEFLKMRMVVHEKKEGPFELAPIDINGLKVPVPLFQGGMGIGISLSRLAAAVSRCGGAGTISAAQTGFNEPDFYTNPVEANKRALKREIRKALEAVKDVKDRGPIGVNIMCASKDYEDYVLASIEAGAEFIVSGAGLPTSLPGIAKNSTVKLIPIVSSARAADIIIKSWAKKYNRTPDALIFEGPLAGGHLGFKEEQLEHENDQFYKTISEIKAVLEEVPDCKLIVGGGIYTKSDSEKVLACGADGIQLATRFVTTEECDAPEEFKQAYLNCKEEDIVIIKSPVGMPARALNNNFVKSVAQKPIPIKECNGCLTTCNYKAASYCITEALVKAAKGDVENGLVFCGGKAYKNKKMETVKEIFDEFVAKE